MAIEHNSFLLLFPLEQDSLLMTVTTLFCFSIFPFVDLDFGLLGSGIVQKLGFLCGLLAWDFFARLTLLVTLFSFGNTTLTRVYYFVLSSV